MTLLATRSGPLHICGTAQPQPPIYLLIEGVCFAAEFDIL